MVAGGMPVLRLDDMLDILGYFVVERHHFVTTGHFKASASAKIILHVYHQQNIGFYIVQDHLTRLTQQRNP